MDTSCCHGIQGPVWQCLITQIHIGDYYVSMYVIRCSYVMVMSDFVD